MKIKIGNWMICAPLAILFGAGLALAQDHVSVPLHDPSRPANVIVNTMNGSITVKGYDGKEVVIEGHGDARRRSEPPAGMHRINENPGLDVEEDNNTVRIKTGLMASGSITIQVPRQSSLNLKTMNGGTINVENVSGEIDANNMNGKVVITNVSGSVVASSMNGSVVVSLDRVTPNKAMSFSTMNGTVDVTLPADVKANVKMKAENGDIFTDFDVKVSGSQQPEVLDNRGRNGKYKVRVDRTFYGTINGGGPEMTFSTYNGRILIHKK